MSLSKAELEESLVILLKAYPHLADERDYELEVCKEICYWLRFMYKDSKVHSQGLAMACATLATWRTMLAGGSCPETISWKAYQLFDRNASPMTMVWKVKTENLPHGQIELKVSEMQGTLAWLEGKIDVGGRIEASLAAAYVCIADAIPQLTAFLNATYETGRLRYYNGCCAYRLRTYTYYK